MKAERRLQRKSEAESGDKPEESDELVQEVPEPEAEPATS